MQMQVKDLKQKNMFITNKLKNSEAGDSMDYDFKRQSVLIDNKLLSGTLQFAKNNQNGKSLLAVESF